MATCPHCHANALRRKPRTFGDRLHRFAAVYWCEQCNQRHALYAVKHCWRCGTDLDRRRRQTLPDRMAALLLLWPYSCRRCGTRRYRWGKRSG